MAGTTETRCVLNLGCRADLTEVRVALQRIHDFLIVQDLPPDMVEDLDLVLAEAMANIVLHGKMGTEGVIECKLLLQDRSVDCRLSDTGVAFDPTCAGLSTPEPMAFSEGGYGWFLIRSLTRNITYMREGPRNVLGFSMRRCAECGAEKCHACCH